MAATDPIHPIRFDPRRGRKATSALPAWAEPRWRPDPSRGSARVLWVGRVSVALLTVVMLALLGRVLQLQTAAPVRVAKLLDSQKSTVSIFGRRGAILDRRGRTLAVSRVAVRLFVDPALIIDRNTFSERVGYGIGYDPFWVEKTLSSRSRSRYIVLDQRLSDERLERFRRLDLPGLAVEPVLVRDYPQGSLAGQLVGFVGLDGDGLEGFEHGQNQRLAGAAGSLRYLRDVRGNPLWLEAASYQPNRDGRNIRLSLDVTIQSFAQTRLAEAVQACAAESGHMIVMDPASGQILALASYPTFDPAEFRQTDAALRRNRPVTDVFEPGSIFKPFIWSVALQLGVAHSDEIIDCTTSGVYYTPRGRRIRDAHPHGRLTWNQVLVLSSNIGMAIVGQRLGAERMHAAVRAFGFGHSSGSGLPGEVAGIVHRLEKWNHYSVTSIPMGQEIGVTPLQMTRAFCAFANGGLLPAPTVEAHDPTEAAQVPIYHRVLWPAVADYTRRVLRRVVTEGTGRKANSKLYALFGKTGTAQLPDFVNGGYHQDQYIASFVAGAPVDSPRLVIGCFIHKPDRRLGHYGGTVAAPAVMRTMEQSLLYLGVPPQDPESMNTH